MMAGGKSGRDEQRERWNDHGRDVAADAFDPSTQLVLAGFEAWCWSIASAEAAVLRASPPLMADDQGGR